VGVSVFSMIKRCGIDVFPFMEGFVSVDESDWKSDPAIISRVSEIYKDTQSKQ
jgi:hypothetical protein